MPGWMAADDRKPKGLQGLFVKEWDNWDKVLLRNSTSRIKKLFRAHYHSRKFEPEQGNSATAGTIWLQGLREGLKPATGKNFLPWWKRGRWRSNPFNANDQLCKKKD